MWTATMALDQRVAEHYGPNAAVGRRLHHLVDRDASRFVGGGLVAAAARVRVFIDFLVE
jgi:hypothetical protein